MKNKLMFAAIAAAAVITACNKENPAPQVQEVGTKSIAINVANVLPGVKSEGKTIADETQVQLNSYQVFFVGGNTLYTPKDITSASDADTYFDDTEVADLDRQFHFLPKAVSEVIVVGNMAQITASSREDLMNKVNTGLTIASQQDPTALLLIGSDNTLTAMDTTAEGYVHEGQQTGTDGEDKHPEPLVRADVNLKPAVARFEITGFEYAQVPATGDQAAPAREYASIAVNNVSMVKFYETATVDALANVTITGTIYKDQLFSLNNIYNGYFNSVDRTQWYFDEVPNDDPKTTDVVEGIHLNSTTSYVWGVNDTDVKNSGKTCYYYHTFPKVVPSFVVGLTGTYSETIGEETNTLVTPLYLQTTALMNGTQEITQTEAGKIYRMYFKFDDTNIKDAEKCIAVYVTVLNWDVVITTPVFGNN